MDLGELLKDPPPGVRLETSPDGTVTIHHRPKGMGCINAFLVVWIAGWTWGLIAGTGENGVPIQGWDRVLFAAIDIAVAALASYLAFTKRAFTLQEDTLFSETNWLWFKWRRQIERTQIRSVKQIQDGGLDEDSFPSWGLEIHVP